MSIVLSVCKSNIPCAYKLLLVCLKLNRYLIRLNLVLIRIVQLKLFLSREYNYIDGMFRFDWKCHWWGFISNKQCGFAFGILTVTEKLKLGFFNFITTCMNRQKKRRRKSTLLYIFSFLLLVNFLSFYLTQYRNDQWLVLFIFWCNWISFRRTMTLLNRKLHTYNAIIFYTFMFT